MTLVIFDLDGTLVDQEGAARTWTQELAEIWSLNAEQSAYVASALSARRPKDIVFEEIIQRLSLPTSAVSLWNDYRSRMPELVRCSDADLDGLKNLRAAGWTLGIATNGMVDNQVGKIRRTGLAELVDGWVISSEVGIRKPDAAIFETLAQRLRCELAGWMIGDSLEMDVAGGVNVGLHTAWISSDADTQKIGDTRPTITVQSVAEAVRHILG